MKRGKQISVDVNENFKVVIGTTDSKNPTAIFINISAWGEPTCEDPLNYKAIIRNLNKRIRQQIFTEINDTYEEYFINKFIVDLDMRESGIRFGKRSYVSCEMTLYQDFTLPFLDNTLQSTLLELTKNLLEEVFEETDCFSYHRKKK